MILHSNTCMERIAAVFIGRQVVPTVLTSTIAVVIVLDFYYKNDELHPSMAASMRRIHNYGWVVINKNKHFV